MEFISENDDQSLINEQYLKKRFGEREYIEFSNYCFRPNLPFVNVNKKGKNGLCLTHAGFDELHKLKEEESRKSQQWLIIIFTFILTISTVVQSYAFVFGSNTTIKAIDYWRTELIGILKIAIFIIVLIILYKITKSILKRFNHKLQIVYRTKIFQYTKSAFEHIKKSIFI